jgi:hypothetical protein
MVYLQGLDPKPRHPGRFLKPPIKLPTYQTPRYSNTNLGLQYGQPPLIYTKPPTLSDAKFNSIWLSHIMNIYVRNICESDCLVNSLLARFLR